MIGRFIKALFIREIFLMNCPDAHLYCASLIKGKLVFEKEGSLRCAIQQGLFLLKAPEGFTLNRV